MTRFIIRRVLHLLPTLIGVTALSFLLISLSPGDFLTTMSMDPTISPDRIAHLRAQYGLDKPWYVQYGLWLYNLSPYRYPAGLKWPDPGYSLFYQMPVLALIGQRFWNTLILSFSAELLVWCTAIPLAMALAYVKRKWIDPVVSMVLFTGISFPQILLSLLALLLAATTGWFPIGGMHSLGYENLSVFGRIIDLLHHLVLPVFVLAIGEFVILVRYARSSLLDTIGSPYILTARSKGLSEAKVLRSHAFPNALNSILTLLGFSIANLISSSFVIEIIMGWPGLGRLAYDAMIRKDIYVLMAALLAGGVFLIVGNLISDILLVVNDPRIRYD
jgi:peptide/nickel transport system permease protein